ncbi:MAG: hypothetical protein H7A24_07445 [Leptospiraceae bacterium]|nr:hypothetical protein [Leptospiraceae bacterium]
MRRFTLLFSLCILSGISIHSYELDREVQIDLDGDGKPESILVKGSEGGAVITINKKKFPIDQEIASFEIVDIQVSDKQKEISLSGSLDYDPVYFLTWKKNQIVLVGKAYSPEIQGNGILYSNSWQGFWSKKDKFTLAEKTHQLKQSEQDFYYVGQVGKVEKSFPIYSNETMSEKLAYLKKGSEIMILISKVHPKDSSKNKYLVKSESNLLGWISEKEIQKFLSGINWAG